ncbi:hypothetical protein WJX79_002313 [Trebouxia sp. C0005]
MTYLVVANIGLAGTQIFGCNAVRDTLLQAIASSNKGVPVGCKKLLDRVPSAQPQMKILIMTPVQFGVTGNACSDASQGVLQGNAYVGGREQKIAIKGLKETVSSPFTFQHR